eukprot:NODE_52_length_30984_cov_1.383358.p17 type:complete len:281 gc:universal NODE_52_length_30984_cov_1.383358:28101-28943(+)
MLKLQRDIEKQIKCNHIIYYEQRPCSYYVNSAQWHNDNHSEFENIEKIENYRRGYLLYININYCIGSFTRVSYKSFLSTSFSVEESTGLNLLHQKRIQYVYKILSNFFFGDVKLTVGELTKSDIGVSTMKQFEWCNDEFQDLKEKCTMISTKRTQPVNFKIDSIYISYSYARLNRINEYIISCESNSLDLSLADDDSRVLIHILCSYEFYLDNFVEKRDPYFLFVYCQKLSRTVGKVHKSLRVKNTHENLKMFRSYLFSHSLRILDELFTVLEFQKITEI